MRSSAFRFRRQVSCLMAEGYGECGIRVGLSSLPGILSLARLSNKLFPAVHTVLVSLAPLSYMVIFATDSLGDLLVHHLAAHRAKAHRGVCAPVIEVGTTVTLQH